MVTSTDHIVACVLGFVIVSLLLGVFALGVGVSFFVFMLVNGGRTRMRRQTPFFGEKVMILFARLSLRPVSPLPFSRFEELDIETSLESS